MKIGEWFRCLVRGAHEWKQPFLRTTLHGEKYVIRTCRKCGRTKKQPVW